MRLALDILHYCYFIWGEKKPDKLPLWKWLQRLAGIFLWPRVCYNIRRCRRCVVRRALETKQISFPTLVLLESTTYNYTGQTGGSNTTIAAHEGPIACQISILYLPQTSDTEEGRFIYVILWLIIQTSIIPIIKHGLIGTTITF